jgi:SAM-dependent methyltransferase
MGAPYPPGGGIEGAYQMAASVTSIQVGASEERAGKAVSGSTQDDAYADRLAAREGVWWKRLLDVQAPYRWNLRRQHLGRTLDIGCGLGRNLSTLSKGSVGVDHNEAAVRECHRRGLNAYTDVEWFTGAAQKEGVFDALLLAHVVEHVESPAALLKMYLGSLKPDGRVFFICPQERGYASDPTHVRFSDGEYLEGLARECALEPDRWFSFPLPRWAGRTFTYNEFCLSASKR